MRTSDLTITILALGLVACGGSPPPAGAAPESGDDARRLDALADLLDKEKPS